MFQTIEILFVIAIMAIQGYIFYISFTRISEYKNILLAGNMYDIIKVAIPLYDIDTMAPRDIYIKLSAYIHAAGQGFSGVIYDGKPYATISIVSLKTNNASPALLDILESVNTYLIRNRSAAADFNLIKDIVERKSSMIEEEINNTISVPLYMGLLGTLLGVIFGLFNISDLSLSTDTKHATEALNNAIPVLLDGVKIAMAASFTGLALTVLNSGMFYRKAKTILEHKKNDFYSFIQVELLPVLNQSINSSLSSLQTNLHKFNEDFSVNLTILGALMHNNHDAVIAQEKIMTKLENIDINNFVNANIRILEELQNSTKSIKVFNKYVENVNEALYNTSSIVTKLSELIDRTDHMNTLAVNINNSFTENKRLMEFLQSHYDSLDNSRQMIGNSVSKVSQVLDGALDQLKEFTTTRINEVQGVMAKELDLLKNEYPEKWKKLDNLVYLEKIGSSINEIKTNNSAQVEKLQEEMSSMHDTLADVAFQLKEIKNSGLTYSIRQLFKRKKVNEN